MYIQSRVTDFANYVVNHPLTTQAAVHLKQLAAYLEPAATRIATAYQSVEQSFPLLATVRTKAVALATDPMVITGSLSAVAVVAPVIRGFAWLDSKGTCASLNENVLRTPFVAVAVLAANIFLIANAASAAAATGMTAVHAAKIGIGALSTLSLPIDLYARTPSQAKPEPELSKEKAELLSRVTTCRTNEDLLKNRRTTATTKLNKYLDDGAKLGSPEFRGQRPSLFTTWDALAARIRPLYPMTPKECCSADTADREVLLQCTKAEQLPKNAESLLQGIESGLKQSEQSIKTLEADAQTVFKEMLTLRITIARVHLERKMTELRDLVGAIKTLTEGTDARSIKEGTAEGEQGAFRNLLNSTPQVLSDLDKKLVDDPNLTTDALLQNLTLTSTDAEIEAKMVSIETNAPKDLAASIQLAKSHHDQLVEKQAAASAETKKQAKAKAKAKAEAKAEAEAETELGSVTKTPPAPPQEPPREEEHTGRECSVQ